MLYPKNFQRPLAALSLAACLLVTTGITGCNKQQSAIDAAKQDVVKTGQPEEVIYVDKDGNTTTTMVTAPAAGTTAPSTAQTVTPAGAQGITGLPDWSNGAHPPPSHVARYSAPGVLAQPATVSAPAAATDPNAQPYNGNVAPAANGAMTAMAPGAAMTAEPNGPPVNFVPANITLPAGTGLAIRINQRIDVKHTAPGEHFTGELAESVSKNGNVILPRGTHVRGVVDASHRRGHFKGASILELRLTSLEVNGQSYPLETGDFVASKKGKGKRTAAFIGGTAGVGMLVGGIASGGLGLAVGGLAGGGLGTLLAGTTGNRDIVIPAESLVRFRLADSLTVQPASAN
jgi:hypothetical protein